jgi:hypothetical protein
MDIWTEKDAALTLARLHILGGKRHLEEGCLTAGLMALYDSILFGMRYYVGTHERCEKFLEDTDLWDTSSLLQALTRSGVFEDPLLFNRFTLTVERSLWQQSLVLDTHDIIAEAEKILIQLGVMPLDSIDQN